MAVRRRTSAARSWRARPFPRVGGNRRFPAQRPAWRAKHNHTARVRATALPRISDMTIGSLGRAAVGAAGHWSGAGPPFEIAARPAGASILMYHTGPPDA